MDDAQRVSDYGEIDDNEGQALLGAIAPNASRDSHPAVEHETPPPYCPSQQQHNLSMLEPPTNSGNGKDVPLLPAWIRVVLLIAWLGLFLSPIALIVFLGITKRDPLRTSVWALILVLVGFVLCLLTSAFMVCCVCHLVVGLDTLLLLGAF